MIGPFIFLKLSYRSCLYSFEINSLSVASFAVIFSHSEGCLFTLLIVCFDVQKLLRLIRSQRGSLQAFCLHEKQPLKKQALKSETQVSSLAFASWCVLGQGTKLL